MAEVVNLRLVRKAKNRADKETAAAANRAKFGATKAERTTTALQKVSDTKKLDGHRRDKPDE